MRELYPPIEPYETGMLDVGDGHRLYWETCGNPAGKPALVLHGGPGSGCTAGSRRPFDPTAYRIVLFDQRGCGRSTPHAGEPSAELSANTTEHLLADIERLRLCLGMERWLIFGGSWGSTLALAYAERHPERVSELILASVTTTTRWEVDWITGGVGQYFPEAWDRLRAGAPGGEGSLIDAYHRLLMSPDPAVHAKAARDWCDWEIAIVALHKNQPPSPRYESAGFRLAFARIVTHYFRHYAWLEDGVLLREAHRLAGIPGALIQGRLDLGCPLITAWRLAQAWPGSELVTVDDAGHDGRDPGMTEKLVAATDRFANRS
jgi:proline iminopeptidase